MKRLTVLGIGLAALAAMASSAHAADTRAKQEGRVWIYSPLVLAFSPNWSLTSMPGGRAEFWRTRETKGGFHFLDYFIGPNYTYKVGDFTLKVSLWYYYMGYPGRGRVLENGNCSVDPNLNPDGTPASTNCVSTYNFSHNIDLIPTVEYRTGNFSISNRIIFHNTVYADVYSNTYTAANLSVEDQRLGWGTVLREMLQVRYAATEKMGLLLADEPFFGIIKDSDTSKMANNAGYKGADYWKTGYRLNRTYVGIDYKVTPALTITPMYLLEVMSSPIDGSDVTDVSHTLYVTVAYVAKLFGDK